MKIINIAVLAFAVSTLLIATVQLAAATPDERYCAHAATVGVPECFGPCNGAPTNPNYKQRTIGDPNCCCHCLNANCTNFRVECF